MDKLFEELSKTVQGTMLVLYLLRHLWPPDLLARIKNRDY